MTKLQDRIAELSESQTRPEDNVKWQTKHIIGLQLMTVQDMLNHMFYSTGLECVELKITAIIVDKSIPNEHATLEMKAMGSQKINGVDLY